MRKIKKNVTVETVAEAKDELAIVLKQLEQADKEAQQIKDRSKELEDVKRELAIQQALLGDTFSYQRELDKVKELLEDINEKIELRYAEQKEAEGNLAVIEKQIQMKKKESNNESARMIAELHSIDTVVVNLREEKETLEGQIEDTKKGLKTLKENMAAEEAKLIEKQAKINEHFKIENKKLKEVCIELDDKMLQAADIEVEIEELKIEKEQELDKWNIKIENKEKEIDKLIKGIEEREATCSLRERRVEKNLALLEKREANFKILNA